jgi:predicted RNase H-like HicB family nuclease/uncharacterized damage-inducible protein DinB
MRYIVYLEVQGNGSALAHVPALPGCTSRGASQELALARVPDAIQSYYAWRRRHGQPVPDDGTPIELDVGGVIGDSAGGLGEAAGLLPSDRAPLTAEEEAHLLQLLSDTRADLLAEVTGLSRSVLNWQPPGHPDEIAWSINDLLEHLARTERVYTSRLSGNVFELLQEARQAAIARLVVLTEAERTRLTRHQGEYWTARKVLRRLLEHEQEHVRQIRQVLDQYHAHPDS